MKFLIEPEYLAKIATLNGGSVLVRDLGQTVYNCRVYREFCARGCGRFQNDADIIKSVYFGGSQFYDFNPAMRLAHQKALGL